jgi:aspartate kinase
VIVQKYSVPRAGIGGVCRRIADTVRSGRQVVAVVAAMGHDTDHLIRLAFRITPAPLARELDMLVANGETTTAPLVAIGLQQMGVPAVSLNGLQAGIQTNRDHANARITSIRPARVRKALREGKVAVVAGFQGVTRDLETTTLGRGGADATAVALASALDAEVCEIYVNSDGIMTADRQVVAAARLLRYVSYEEILELAALGLRVMQPRALEMGEQLGVPIHVRSAQRARPGTMIASEVPPDERRLVSAVAYAPRAGIVRVQGLPNRPGTAAAIFEALGQHGISVDVIASAGANNLLAFMVQESQLDRTLEAIDPAARDMGAAVSHTSHLAKVAIVGSGMRDTPGSAARLLRTLADAGVHVEMIATADVRITCAVRRDDGEPAVRALHAGFGLGRAPGYRKTLTRTR